jgi:hypothetical protein
MTALLSTVLTLTAAELLVLVVVAVAAGVAVEGVFSLAFFARHSRRLETALDARTAELVALRRRLEGVDHGD